MSAIDQLTYTLSDGPDIILYMAEFSSSIFMSSRLPSAKPFSLKYAFSSAENSPSVEGAIGITPSLAPRMTAARMRPGVCELVQSLDAAYEWCAAHCGDYEAFVTCGARDPGLPALAARISETRLREAERT